MSKKFGIYGPDAAATFKTSIKEIAQLYNNNNDGSDKIIATFHSKPFGLELPGNGGHFNFSLWESKSNNTNKNTMVNEQNTEECLKTLSPIHTDINNSNTDKTGIQLSERNEHFMAGTCLNMSFPSYYYYYNYHLYHFYGNNTSFFIHLLILSLFIFHSSFSSSLCNLLIRHSPPRIGSGSSLVIICI